MTRFRKLFPESNFFVGLVVAYSLSSFIYFSLKLPLTVPFVEFGHFYYYADVLKEIQQEKVRDEERLFDLIAKPRLRQEAKFPLYEQMPKPTEVFLYPPILYFLFRPFLSFPFQVASYAWYGLNQAFFWGTLFLFFRLFAESPSSQKRPLVLFASLNFVPVQMTLEVGQINLLTLFLFTLAFYLQRKGKEGLSGVCLGLAILTKIIPLLLILYFAWKRRWRVVCAGLATILLAYGISIATFGWPLHWVQWSRVTPAYSHTSIATTVNHQGISAATTVNHQGISAFWFHLFSQRGRDYPLVQGPFNAEGIASVLSLASRVFLFVFAFWCCRFYRRTKPTPSEFSFFVVVMLLIAPWVTTFHILYLLFPLVACATEDNLHRKEEICLILAYLLTGTAYWFDGFAPFRRGWGVLFLSGRLYGMLLLGWVLLQRIRRQQAA